MNYLDTLRHLSRSLFETDTHFSNSSAAALVYLIFGEGAVAWLKERRDEPSSYRSERLGLHDLYVLSSCPSGVRARGGNYKFPLMGEPAYTVLWYEHPLHIASMHLYAGRRQSAIAILNEYKEMCKALGNNRHWTNPGNHEFPPGFFPSSGSSNSWLAQPICPVGPEQHGLDLLPWHPSTSRVGYAMWYQPNTLRTEFESLNYAHNLKMLREIVDVTGPRWRHLVAVTARTYLTKAMTRHAADYEEAAFAIRVAGDVAAEQVLSNNTINSREAAWCMLPSATSEQMKRGLAAIGKSVAASTRETVLQRMGRAPTAEELASIRGGEYARVLFHMPWEFLEPAATDEDGVVLLRAKLAKFLKSHPLEIIKNALVPHEHRLVAADLPEPLTQGEPPPIEATEWFSTYSIFERAREDNAKRRLLLLDLAEEDPEVAVLLALVAVAPTNRTIARVLTPSIHKLAEQCPGYAIVNADPERYAPIFIRE